MSSPQPPHNSQTLLGQVTQAVKTMQAKVNFGALTLKPNAKVPELRVQDAGADKADVYPLIGDRYLLGRSSKSCDIVIRNPVISQIHLSVSRDSRRSRRAPFVIKDENSTNGVYRGKRRLTSLQLRHGDVITLGPPELAASVRVQYVDPPPWYVRAANWGTYGIGGITILVLLGIGIEWVKAPAIRPLPTAAQGPVIVYAQDGQTPLRPLQNTAHVDMKQLSDFGPYLPKAVIASEDSRFYWHLGVDPIGIMRAVLVDTRNRAYEQGASTLTQQVARSLFRNYVGTKDSLNRKLREAIVALKLETFYSKDFILLTYLNRVYLGHGTYGFEDAAQYYFGKSVKELDLSEAATLVGILPAPNSFNFCGDVQSRQRAAAYRDRVIDRMLEQGKIALEQANRARRSSITVSRKVCEEQSQTIAPYFYSYLFQELQSILGEQLASEGNFTIETQLDPRIQAASEASLQRYIHIAGANYGFSQGAIVTLDGSTGAVLALTGGINYQKSQFNRAVQAERQPGSSFKIFTYAAAIEKGVSPEKTYSCAPLNWQGRHFRGCERLESDSANMYAGLAQSENVIALRIAQEDVGLNNVVRMARRLGIQSPLDPVPGLVIGQSAVNVLEITGAYGALSHRGVWNRPHLIDRILDSSDCRDRTNPKTCRVIYSFNQSDGANVKVLQPEVAEVMTELLQGVIQNGTGSNAAIGLGEAGKTGTTDNDVDLWFVGYIPSRQLVTGIWLGNDNNSPTAGGSAQAARLWGEYMRRVVGE
ncbi:MAG: transglycosylase domain-containing protein [Chroococcidiopsidaceae cyanobacterium CP_BM_RX_35]|nr:transglycosylase domain-containing protein [Chroococcidiopsidaceae cyanobacterium CP_BM_RX_35]